MYFFDMGCLRGFATAMLGAICHECRRCVSCFGEFMGVCIVTGQVTAVYVARLWTYFVARRRHFSVVSQPAVNISVGAITAPYRSTNVVLEIQREIWSAARPTWSSRSTALEIHKQYPASDWRTGDVTRN